MTIIESTSGGHVLNVQYSGNPDVPTLPIGAGYLGHTVISHYNRSDIVEALQEANFFVVDRNNTGEEVHKREYEDGEVFFSITTGKYSSVGRYAYSDPEELRKQAVRLVALAEAIERHNEAESSVIAKKTQEIADIEQFLTEAFGAPKVGEAEQWWIRGYRIIDGKLGQAL